MNYFMISLISFCAGWGFMDILGRVKFIPEIVRWILLGVFCILLGKFVR